MTGDCWRIGASFCRSTEGRFFLAGKRITSNIWLLTVVACETRTARQRRLKNKFFDEVYKYYEKEKSIGNVRAVRSSKRRLCDGCKCGNYAWQS